MFSRRLLPAAVLVLAANVAAAQTGPTLLTVFPPGAKAGTTTEVTVAGSGFDGDEQLLFSGGKLTAERVTEKVAVDPKAKTGGGRMATQQATNAVKFKVTVPEGEKAETLDVRVVSKSGLSNPRAFVVGKDAEVNEVEPNNDVPQAQLVEMNTTVNGVISAPNDVDYVKFTAKAGQNVVVYCLATSIDSRLHADIMVAGPDGKQLAANHGYRGGDAVLDFLPPADGEYVVRVSQFAYTSGGPDHFYRLTVTTGKWIDAMFPPLASGQEQRSWRVYGRGFEITGKPMPLFNRPDGRPFDYTSLNGSGGQFPPKPTDLLTGETPITPSSGSLDGHTYGQWGFILLNPTGPVVRDNEANGTADKAQAVTVPCDIAGRIARKNDRHWYAFDAKKGEVWTLEVFAERIGSPVDAYFLLTDAKGKTLAEVDDGPDTLSPNQFYTKSDDPGRYKFTAPADGTYRVLVSTREAAVQFGVRDQYVLRIAKEKPDFRLAVMPLGPHYPDAATLPKNGAVLLAVFAWRFDGFDGPITLSAENLPPGVTCPPQVLAPGQVRGTLVLTADTDAADWAGFVTVTGSAKAGDAALKHTARPFSITWQTPGVQLNQPPPNSPMLARMDRGPGLAVAVRGEAPFKLAVAADGPIKATAGGKVELTVTVERKTGMKDAVQLFSGTPGVGPRQQGNQPLPALATIPADKTEAKVSLDLPPTLPPGAYSFVVRGQSGVTPKGQNARVPATYPAVPVTVEVEGKAGPMKR